MPDPIRIDSITLCIGEVTLSLSLADARTLRNVLNEALGIRITQPYYSMPIGTETQSGVMRSRNMREIRNDP